MFRRASQGEGIEVSTWMDLLSGADGANKSQSHTKRSRRLSSACMTLTAATISFGPGSAGLLLKMAESSEFLSGGFIRIYTELQIEDEKVLGFGVERDRCSESQTGETETSYSLYAVEMGNCRGPPFIVRRRLDDVSMHRTRAEGLPLQAARAEGYPIHQLRRNILPPCLSHQSHPTAARKCPPVMLPALTARLASACRPAGLSSRFSRMSSSLFRQLQHTVNAAHTREYLGGTVGGDDDRPLLSVKQYVPLDNPDPQPGDVTIIGAHANGFSKVRSLRLLFCSELYEPLWDEVYQLLAHRGVRVRSVWIADMWNQGQSGVLNEKMLGNDPSWFDHARDLMSLINQKLDDIRHPIVGIGHSMGATQLSLLSLSHPRLLDALVLIDPVIQLGNVGIVPAVLSTRRRDVWPSMKAASEKFKKSEFYKSWDARVLERWTEYGLRPLPTELHPAQAEDDEGVTLTTTKHQELFTFLRPTYDRNSKVDMDPDQAAKMADYPFYRPEPAYVYKHLPNLRPSTLYVFGEKSDVSTPELREEKMAMTGTGVGGSGGVVEGRVQQITLNCGHLVPMEKVEECALAITDFLDAELARQRREAMDHQAQLAQLSRREQMAIDDRWARLVKPEEKLDDDEHFENILDIWREMRLVRWHATLDARIISKWQNDKDGGSLGPRLLLAPSGPSLVYLYMHACMSYEHAYVELCIYIHISYITRQERPRRWKRKKRTKQSSPSPPCMSMPPDAKLQLSEQIPWSEPAWHHTLSSPYYNESHRRLRDSIRRYIDAHVLPFSPGWEEAGCAPRAEAVRFSASGIPFQDVPDAYRPAHIPRLAGLPHDQLDAFHFLVAADETARVEGGVVIALAGASAIGVPPILHHASDEQKARWLPGLFSAETSFCLGVTEPLAGSDVAGLTTTAELASGQGGGRQHYVVNGAKKWISGAPWATHMTTAVRTGGGKGKGGISVLVIPLSLPGISMERIENSGQKAGGSCLIHLDDVRVPAANLVGRENEGFPILMTNFNKERFLLAVACNRKSRTCLAMALWYATRRETFGRPLLENQVIRRKIAEVAHRVEAHWAWLEQVAFHVQNGPLGWQGPDLAARIALLKVQGGQMLELAAREAQQVFGGAGYQKAGPGATVEQISRDLRMMVVGGGSEEVITDLAIRQELLMAKLIIILGRKVFSAGKDREERQSFEFY
ncbi:hypothetical protein L249_1207 [Ophiocordyceps polyrhachis-furcata BCC 54312]|uniref:AB hydrolase-1 domain-containing protein n=1 Tax=Ophiocordyceps polyrhachis-furcata BCC 54312 TaxID=1330021 RepID=A0A367LFZ9_9HYPO|nr:hypothetical protein L249_1207 [Ophiocordyceps polyrhachis-furcata BCC 54312]